MKGTSLQIRRIMQEIKDLENNKSYEFHAAPLENEIHIWHFTIRGPPKTEFEGGIYHGKIELPIEYPLKPPAIYFLTPSGRYELNTKICLTITDYHPEAWNPAWTIRSMLQALISYFPEKEKVTGVGALEYSKDERKKLALLSRSWKCPICGPIVNLLPIPEQQQQQPQQQVQNNQDSTVEKDQKEAEIHENPVEETNTQPIASSKDQEDNIIKAEEPFEIKNNNIQEIESIKTQSLPSNTGLMENNNNNNNNKPEREILTEIQQYQQQRKEIKIKPTEVYFKPEVKKNLKTNIPRKKRQDLYNFALEKLLLEHKQYFDARESITFGPNPLSNDDSLARKNLQEDIIKENNNGRMPEATTTTTPSQGSQHHYHHQQGHHEGAHIPEDNHAVLKIKKNINILSLLQVLISVLFILYFFTALV